MRPRGGLGHPLLRVGEGGNGRNDPRSLANETARWPGAPTAEGGYTGVTDGLEDGSVKLVRQGGEGCGVNGGITPGHSR